MRRGFTLVELLVIVAILAVMTTVAVVSVRSGQEAARIKGAARDIFAAIRHARSVALLSQQPSVIEYSEVQSEGETCACIKLTTAKVMADDGPEKAATIKGGTVWLNAEAEAAAIAKRKESRLKTPSGVGELSGQGQSVADILFQEIDADLLRGVRIKIEKESVSSSSTLTEKALTSKISVFSTSDYILGRYAEQKAKSSASAAQGAQASGVSSASDAGGGASSGFTPGVVIGKAQEKASAVEPLQENVAFVWETNGRTEPHRIWIYQEGSRYDKGLSIKIDRFGGARVVSSDDK